MTPSRAALVLTHAIVVACAGSRSSAWDLRVEQDRHEELLPVVGEASERLAPRVNVSLSPLDGARDEPRPKHRRSRPAVAVLYSGRWLGAEASADMVDNHVRHLLAPNRASVFVVADATNWCDADPAVADGYVRGLLDAAQAESALCDDVRSAFGASRRAHGWVGGLHCALVPTEDERVGGHFVHAGISELLRYRIKSSYVGAMLRTWYLQFNHLRRVEELRHVYGPHDVVVRARLDVAFAHAVDVSRLQLSGRLLYALTFYARREAGDEGFDLVTRGECRPAHGPTGLWNIMGVNTTRPCPAPPGGAERGALIDADGHPHARHAAATQLWRDWIYVGSAGAFGVLANIATDTRVLSSISARCVGLCPEEQTVLQLRRRGVELRPLSWRVYLASPPCDLGRGLRPLVNETSITRLFGIPKHHSPCDRVVGTGRRGWCAMLDRLSKKDMFDFEPVPLGLPRPVCRCPADALPRREHASHARAGATPSRRNRTGFRTGGKTGGGGNAGLR